MRIGLHHHHHRIISEAFLDECTFIIMRRVYVSSVEGVTIHSFIAPDTATTTTLFTGMVLIVFSHSSEYLALVCV